MAFQSKDHGRTGTRLSAATGPALRTGVLALLAVVLPAGQAVAEVRDSSSAGFTVHNVVTVPVDAAAAWKALAEDVDAWWPKDHSWFGKDGRFNIDTRAGGCFCEIAGARQAQHMQIGFVEPGVRMRMLGGLGPLQGMGLHGALDWSFEAIEGGTRITLHYVVGGYTTEDLVRFAPLVDQVQGLQLGALARYLGSAP